MRRFLVTLGGAWLCFSTLTSWAMTDSEILEKYLVPAYQTPEEPRHCRGMTKVFESWADMLHEAEILRDKAARNASQMLGRAEAGVQSAKRGFDAIQGYLRRHCHT